ncbi:hypothetical protein V3320_02740 [Mycoplasmopsis agalactiae]|uniref:MAG5150 family histidine triad lipoprotein n=1 Tax=Mycoplasmopsis agalactiae TaxID=2110 RepID=UPI002F3FBABE
MKNKLKKYLLLTPLLSLPMALSAKCNGESSNQGENNTKSVSELIKQYKEKIDKIESNFLAKKVNNSFHSDNSETKNFFNAALYENLVNNVANASSSYDMDKKMQEFYDLVKKDEQAYKTVKDSFFDYEQNSQSAKITKALVAIVNDLNVQVLNNSNKFFDDFNNKDSKDNSKIIYYAYPQLSQSATFFTNKEWSEWIQDDFRVVYSSLINYDKSTLIEPSQFKSDLIKIYDSNTGVNSNHNHSHATYSMIWEFMNYLNAFREIANKLNYAESVKNIKNELKNKPELLKLFDQLTSKTDLLVKNSELKLLNPLYDKAREAFKLLDDIRIALKRIADSLKLDSSTVNKILPA